MYYNNYSLRQLLELALRVPEVGAVNFNILYYILKAIIQEQGLEEIKPVFSLDVPLNVPSRVLKTQVNGVSLRRSYSAESLEHAQLNKIDKQDSPEKISKKAEKERDKWQKILLFKRLDAVEEEISEIHIMISQLVDKVSNSERVCGLQETKFRKDIADLYDLIESKGDPNFAKKLEEISSQVEMLMRIEMESEKSSDGLVPSETALDATKLDEIKSFESDQDESLPEDVKLEGVEVDDSELDEIKETKLETIPNETESPDSNLVTTKEEATEKTKKTSRRKAREQEILEKIESLVEEVSSIKEQMKVKSSFQLKHKEAEETVYNEKEISDIVERIIRENESITRADVSKIDLELLTVSAEIHKAIEKCAAMDKTFNSDIKILKEKNLILEKTVYRQDEDLEALKVNWDEMVHNFENVKENVQYIEKEMTMLTEFPGIKNRIEQLEGYIYSEGEAMTLYPKSSVTEDLFIAEAEKQTSEKKDIKSFKPIVETEKARTGDIQEYSSEDRIGETYEDDYYKDGQHINFLAVSRDVVLVQDMERKRRAPKFKIKDLYTAFDDDDDDNFYFDKPIYEIGEESIDEHLGSIKEVPSHAEVITKHSEEKIRSSAFTSPDILEEYSQQLRGQIIVFVRKRLNDFEMQLQDNESIIANMRNKIDSLGKSTKELGEKLTFMDANFNQRAGDLAALKEMTGNHQVSIVNIVHHLDRKAESYAVNQKVSRKELTVIENRVLKLCVTTSSEISKLEEKIDLSLEKFNFELDKKLYIEEFDHRLKFFLHKLKMLENKLKELPVESSILDIEGIRPVEIKKYVACKDGTKIKQDRKKLTTWNAYESVIPILTEHHVDVKTSPKTALQVQKELELASYRESKRYVDGAYTKIKVGRK